jgi:serine/threonine protein phosphatase 1
MKRWFRPDRNGDRSTSLFGRRGNGDHDGPENGRRLVVGDIHGCSRTARALLVDGVGIRSGDALYLLGDLISKGPDSLGVLRFVVELEAMGVDVTIVRGNHEEAILEARKAGGGKLATLLERTRNSGLLAPDGSGDLDARWLSLLERSVYFVELPDAILVHGGVDMSTPEPFEDGSRMVSMRETTYHAHVAGNRPVIHGHTRSPLSVIIEALVRDSPVLPLDNGAVAGSSEKPFKVSEFGNLCCLDLDSRRLHVQPNRDAEDDEHGRATFCLTVDPAHQGS